MESIRMRTRNSPGDFAGLKYSSRLLLYRAERSLFQNPPLHEPEPQVGTGSIVIRAGRIGFLSWVGFACSPPPRMEARTMGIAYGSP